MRWQDEDDDPVVFHEARGVAATELALLCAWDGHEHWVPQSVIHEDSEVWEAGQEGKLVLARWWAEKEGFG